MTGPECYQEAQRLIGEAHENQFHNGSGDPVTQELLTEAQVFATLALAAATALGGSDGPPAPDWDAWYRAASEGPGEKQRRREREAAEAAELAEEATS